MKIGSSIALIAIGAILAFAVADAVDFIDLTMIGYILIAAGVIGLIATLALTGRSHKRVSESRTAVDPGTGEAITTHSTVDNGSPAVRRDPLV
jgi:hypothetical protein